MISVIIPVLNAEKYIGKQLAALNHQTLKPSEIIVVDSESEDATVEIARNNENTVVLSVKRSEFDHGRTRDMAMRKAKGEYVLFLTQDAEIEDDHLLEKMRADFYDSSIAAVTGRQLPKKDADAQERYIRAFNYPPYSSVRSKEDLAKLGIKTFFMSDVCTMYRRDIYLSLGGFEYPLKTNEDMFYAAKIIQAGYKIVYDANACVMHSHNFTLKQQYERNYIQGYEMEKHRDLLENVSAGSEGLKLAVNVSENLLKRGKIVSFFHFGADCLCRYMGNKKGHQDARRS